MQGTESPLFIKRPIKVKRKSAKDLKNQWEKEIQTSRKEAYSSAKGSDNDELDIWKRACWASDDAEELKCKDVEKPNNVPWWFSRNQPVEHEYLDSGTDTDGEMDDAGRHFENFLFNLKKYCHFMRRPTADETPADADNNDGGNSRSGQNQTRQSPQSGTGHGAVSRSGSAASGGDASGGGGGDDPKKPYSKPLPADGPMANPQNDEASEEEADDEHPRNTFEPGSDTASSSRGSSPENKDSLVLNNGNQTDDGDENLELRSLPPPTSQSAAELSPSQDESEDHSSHSDSGFPQSTTSTASGVQSGLGGDSGFPLSSSSKAPLPSGVEWTLFKQSSRISDKNRHTDIPATHRDVHVQVARCEKLGLPAPLNEPAEKQESTRETQREKQAVGLESSKEPTLQSLHIKVDQVAPSPDCAEDPSLNIVSEEELVPSSGSPSITCPQEKAVFVSILHGRAQPSGMDDKVAEVGYKPLEGPNDTTQNKQVPERLGTSCNSSDEPCSLRSEAEVESFDDASEATSNETSHVSDAEGNQAAGSVDQVNVDDHMERIALSGPTSDFRPTCGEGNGGSQLDVKSASLHGDSPSDKSLKPIREMHLPLSSLEGAVGYTTSKPPASVTPGEQGSREAGDDAYRPQDNMDRRRHRHEKERHENRENSRHAGDPHGFGRGHVDTHFRHRYRHSFGCIIDSMHDRLRVVEGHYDEEDQFEVIESLGRGGQGECLLCQDRNTGFQFVAKKVSIFHSEEIEAMLQLRNQPGAVQVYGVLYAEGNFLILQEFVRGSNLREVIDQRTADNEPFSLYDALDILHQILQFLEYLHSEGIEVCHEDLKPENIMVENNPEGRSQFRVRLVDFGLARIGPTPPNIPPRGTALYMSPEKAARMGHGFPADIFAAFTLFLLLLLTYLSRESISFRDALFQLARYEASRDHRTLDLPPTVQKLLSQGLCRNPKDRPTAAQLLESPAFDLLNMDPEDPIFHHHTPRRSTLSIRNTEVERQVLIPDRTPLFGANAAAAAGNEEEHEKEDARLAEATGFDIHRRGPTVSRSQMSPEDSTSGSGDEEVQDLLGMDVPQNLPGAIGGMFALQRGPTVSRSQMSPPNSNSSSDDAEVQNLLGLDVPQNLPGAIGGMFALQRGPTVSRSQMSPPNSNSSSDDAEVQDLLGLDVPQNPPGAVGGEFPPWMPHSMPPRPDSGYGIQVEDMEDYPEDEFIDLHPPAPDSGIDLEDSDDTMDI